MQKQTEFTVFFFPLSTAVFPLCLYHLSQGPQAHLPHQISPPWSCGQELWAERCPPEPDCSSNCRLKEENQTKTKKVGQSDVPELCSALLLKVVGLSPGIEYKKGRSVGRNDPVGSLLRTVCSKPRAAALSPLVCAQGCSGSSCSV